MCAKMGGGGGGSVSCRQKTTLSIFAFKTRDIFAMIGLKLKNVSVCSVLRKMDIEFFL